MAEISSEHHGIVTEEKPNETSEITSQSKENTNHLEEEETADHSKEVTVPRLVSLKRKNKSFGLKLRGQAAEGGPRWLINGKVYKNLHTVSAVAANSSAEESGVKVGDKILSINGVDVEGAQHDQLQDLMSNSAEDVEMLVVAPGEAQMLDMPAEVLIHRSDGSTTSISNSVLLQTGTIDEALEHEDDRKADKEDVIKVQVHAMSDKPDDVEVDRTEDSEGRVEVKEENYSSTSEEGSNDIDNEVQDADSTPEQQSGNVDGSVEEKCEENCEENVADVNEENIEGTVDISEHSETSLLGDNNEEKPLNNNETVTESCEDIKSNDEEIIETTDKTVETTDETVETTDETVENTKEKEISGDFGSNDQISVSQTCSCGQEKQNRVRKHTRKSEMEREKILRQMRMISASMKRLKVSPFSPDTFNNLSPYFSMDSIQEDSCHQVKMGQCRSWRYTSQRPTALMVLDPAAALRLENSPHQRQARLWSSNFVEKDRLSSSEVNEEAGHIREELNKVYKNLIKKRTTSGKMYLNRYLQDEKFVALSKHFIKANAKETILTYMNHWKVS